MDSLVQDRIYRRVALMDYQGVCSDQNNPYSAAPRSKHPISWILKYIMTLASTWIAMVPEPISAWSNYESGYLDNTNDDQEDTVYPEDYEDEPPRFGDDHDVTTPQTVSYPYNYTMYQNTFELVLSPCRKLQHIHRNFQFRQSAQEYSPIHITPGRVT